MIRRCRGQWRGAPALAVLALLLCGWLPAFAGDTVVFRNGRRMRVESTEMLEGLYVLRLKNGGVIRVPTDTVERIVPDPEPEPDRPGAAGAEAHGETGDRVAAFIASRRAGDLHPLISRAARRHGLEEALLVAVVSAESAFDPAAVSPKGAMGLMQLMPDTAERFGVERPFDPWENLDGGAAFLRQLLDRYGGDLKLALAAYNAGEGRIRDYQGMPPFSETVNYVSRVTGLYRSFLEGGD